MQSPKVEAKVVKIETKPGMSMTDPNHPYWQKQRLQVMQSDFENHQIEAIAIVESK